MSYSRHLGPTRITGTSPKSCVMCELPLLSDRERFCPLCRYDLAAGCFGAPPQRASPNMSAVKTEDNLGWLLLQQNHKGPLSEKSPSELWSVPLWGLTIGRKEPSNSHLLDIAIDDSAISKQHMKIRFDGNQRFLVHDLGSTNGCLVNQVLLPPNEQLEMSIERNKNIAIQLGNSTKITVFWKPKVKKLIHQ